MKKIVLGLGVVMMSINSIGQETVDSVDMIIDNYIENIGGADAWNELEGVKMTAEVDAQGMSIPLEVYQMADGKTLTKFTFQGMEMVQGAFDGEVMWSTNFMTQEAEAAESEETENMKRNSADGNNPFMDYKDKGYTVELVGYETIDGVDCYKLKLVKGTLLVEGEEVDNISYTYFDQENFVPIQTESEIHTGQMKGQNSITLFSDYEEVDGLYFPFSITYQSEAGEGQTIEFDSIELNPEVEDDFFNFPGEK